MLSRMAESLYWLSRYIERAENLARILDLAERLATLPSAYAGTSNEWESAIATAACKDAFYECHEDATRDNVIAFIVCGETNASSIRTCIQTARSNARTVRTALTTEMWEIINGGWHEMNRVNLEALTPGELSQFLSRIKQLSLSFDGAAYRTMLRKDQYWFQRLGTFVERSDNVARLLDVKYHVLLPDNEPVGGGLDYFQWASLLRSLSALTSYHWVYRESLRPWLVAEFLILRPEQPRSLISCYESINGYLDKLADTYGRQGPSQRLARSTYTRLQNTDIEVLFQDGLHEFLGSFIHENNQLGSAITEQYLS
jgi:uncharacterized alpha-E superfamily protein